MHMKTKANFKILRGLFDKPVEGLARVIMPNDKYNFVDWEYNAISTRNFQYAENFCKGFAKVMLRNWPYKLNLKGQLCDFETEKVIR